MHATKLVNEKLLIFCKKYKHLKKRNAHCLTSLGKNIFIPNQEILLTLALKGIGVSKNSTIKPAGGSKQTTSELLFFSNGSSRKSFTSFDTYFVLLEQLTSLSNKWSMLKKSSPFLFIKIEQSNYYL